MQGIMIRLLPELHRSDQSGLSAGPLSGRPFPYGQKYLGPPQKIAVVLSPTNQEEGRRQEGRGVTGPRPAVIEIPVESPQEANPFIGGRTARHCGVGTHGCGVRAQLPSGYPPTGEHL